MKRSLKRFHLPDPTNSEQWLEVHKLPKEQWFKEVDAMASTRRQAAAKRAAAAVSTGCDFGFLVEIEIFF